MEKMDVTVIVPVHEGAQVLPTFLAHLELQSHPAARFEVILVDSGSTDGTCEVAQRYADGAPIRTQCLRFGDAQAGEALTAAAMVAAGRWLLFLHQDLLAGVHLIRSHVRAQEYHGGDVAVRGKVEIHPQSPLSAELLVPLFEEPANPGADATVPYRQWRLWNLSVARDSVRRIGFASAFPFPDYADVDLAWRLHREGMQGYYSADAAAYLWYLPDFAEERRRAFAQGYCRHVLLSSINDFELRRQFHMQPPGWLPPLGEQVLRKLAGNNHPNRGFRGFARRHVLRRAMDYGARAAAAGQPPTPPQ